MATSKFERTYEVGEFTALGGPLEPNRTLLESTLLALPLSVPPVALELAEDGSSAIVHFDAKPTDADLVALDAAVAGFAGLPFEINSFGATQANSAAEVTKIEVQTPALNKGKYQVIWTSTTRMNPAAANGGVQGKMRVARSDGTALEQPDSWDLAFDHAFNGVITFTVEQGQSLNVLLTVARLGTAGVAQMSGARVTIDKMK